MKELSNIKSLLEREKLNTLDITYGFFKCTKRDDTLKIYDNAKKKFEVKFPLNFAK